MLCLNFFLLWLLLCQWANAVSIAYDVTCTGCGQGGYYTLQQTSPSLGTASHDPNIICNLGDTITFNFPVALAGWSGLNLSLIGRHPFSIYVMSSYTPFPGVTFSSYTGTGPITFNNLQTQTQARYQCDVHASMKGYISLAGAPTSAPPPAGVVGNVSASTSVTADLSQMNAGPFDLGGGMQLWWKTINPGVDQYLDFAIQVPMDISNQGWVGIGFSSTTQVGPNGGTGIGGYKMIGSDAFIGYLSNSSTGYVATLGGFLLTSKALDTSGIVAAPRLIVYGNAISVVNVRRALNQGINPIVPDAYGQYLALFIAAYSESSTPGINQKHTCHSGQGFGNYFQGGTGAVYRSNSAIRIAHGVLMGVAYAFLFPLGVMVARYAKATNGWWFKFHFFIQNFTFLIVIAAIIIGYYMPEIQFQQLSWHAPLGTAIFILTFFQVISGYIRPHKGEVYSVQRTIFEVFHHWNGRCILLLALAQIIAGYFELGVPKWAYGIWLPFLGAFVFISLVLEVWKLFRPHHDKLDIHYVL